MFCDFRVKCVFSRPPPHDVFANELSPTLIMNNVSPLKRGITCIFTLYSPQLNVYIAIIKKEIFNRAFTFPPYHILHIVSVQLFREVLIHWITTDFILPKRHVCALLISLLVNFI